MNGALAQTSSSSSPSITGGVAVRTMRTTLPAPGNASSSGRCCAPASGADSSTAAPGYSNNQSSDRGMPGARFATEGASLPDARQRFG